jgi:hypothetical protein
VQGGNFNSPQVIFLLSSRLSFETSQRVPDDVLALIFYRLDLVDFCAAAGTCRMWHAAVCKKSAWPHTVSGVRFDTQLPSEQRPLSQTVWAACNHVVVFSKLDRYEWFDKIEKELPHVSSLSLVGTRLTHAFDLNAYRVMLGRITTLHTNVIELVQAASCGGQLTSLTIANHHSGHAWARLLLTLPTLRYVAFDCSACPESLGIALAQLAHRHGRLRSIRMPVSPWDANYLLVGLLQDATLDLSSLRAMVGAPAHTVYMYRAIKRMPHLAVYIPAPSTLQCVDTCWLRRHPSLARGYDHDKFGLTSFAFENYDSAHVDPRLQRLLPTLTELAIYQRVNMRHALVGPYPRLRLLRLVLSTHSCLSFPLVISSATNLEYLSLCSKLEWLYNRQDKGESLPAWFQDLSALSHFRPSL